MSCPNGTSPNQICVWDGTQWVPTDVSTWLQSLGLCTYPAGGVLASDGDGCPSAIAGPGVDGDILVSDASNNLPSWKPLATEALDAIKTVDGAGSGLDADFLRGHAPDVDHNADTVALRDGSGHLNVLLGLVMASRNTAYRVEVHSHHEYKSGQAVWEFTVNFDEAYGSTPVVVAFPRGDDVNTRVTDLRSMTKTTSNATIKVGINGDGDYYCDLIVVGV